jgi:hypothetical protein
MQRQLANRQAGNGDVTLACERPSWPEQPL